MNLKLIYRNIIIAICILCLPACDDQWDDHVEVNNNRETETIMKVIESTPETSVFASILKKTGYDNFLSGDKAVTVFAPVNSALEGINMEDDEALRLLVRNHIAYLSYSVVNGSFTTDTIEMINSKRLKAHEKSIDDIALIDNREKYNITTANGLLHMVDGVIYTKDNIWEYLQKQSGYSQVDFLVNLNYREMDMEKSVQTGISPNGRPLYDTVWIDKNAFLEQYPINDESKNYTFVLLESNVLNRIESKYAKYFVRIQQAQQDSIVRAELLKDCILLPLEITADGRYSSVDGVLMDINLSNIAASYKASNGIVYKLSDGDVKVYQNKLQDIIIEAENYAYRYADGNAWSLRRRSWASGGYDMMLNSTTRNYFSDSIFTNGDTIVVNETYIYNSGVDNAGSMGRVANCYLGFFPILNSVGYKISCMTIDDIPRHYNLNSSEYWYPMVLEQKLLISFPESPQLMRTNTPNVGTIENNFSETTMFVSKTQAHAVTNILEEEEIPFYRYNANMETDGVKGIYMVAGRATPQPALEDENIYQETDEYGDKEFLICPRYGRSTVFIANAVRETGANSGMIFLDYIRFSPIVDPND